MPLLDLFRYVAALCVALIHYQYYFAEPFQTDILAWSGLSFFFMLSGFVLTYRYYELPRSQVKTFYLRRLIRIYPLYALAVVSGFLLSYYGYQAAGNEYFAQSGRPWIMTGNLPHHVYDYLWEESLWKHLLFLQLWSEGDHAKYLINAPLWSIANEMFFYLCFPLLVPITRYLRSLPACLVAIVVVIALQHVVFQFKLPDDSRGWFDISATVYTSPLLRIWEFVLGIVLFQAYLLCRDKISAKQRYLLLAVAAVVYAATYLSHYNLPYEYMLYLYLVPSIALLLFALAMLDFQPGEKTRAFMFQMGGASYVLYCMHVVVFEGLRLANINQDTLPGHVFWVFGALTLAGIAIYLWVEAPLHRRLRRWLTPKNQPTN